MKLVLTGGPSGGKTTMALAISRAFCERVIVIPEAASILFSGGFRRTNYPQGIMHQQKAIYRVQVEHEAIFEHEFSSRFIICDRGTLDGRAYWPRGDETFFKEIGSDLDLELKRYDWVIHLDTASIENYDHSNKLRKETPQEANHVNERVKSAWEGHPQRFIIPSTESFAKKVMHTLSIVEQILLNSSYQEICKKIQL